LYVSNSYSAQFINIRTALKAKFVEKNRTFKRTGFSHSYVRTLAPGVCSIFNKGLYVCAGGVGIIKLPKLHQFWCFIFQFGGLGALFGELSRGILLKKRCGNTVPTSIHPTSALIEVRAEL